MEVKVMELKEAQMFHLFRKRFCTFVSNKEKLKFIIITEFIL